MNLKSIILVLLVIIPLQSQTYIIPDLQRDDFATKKAWWIFQHHGNQTDATTHNGYLHAQLVNPLDGNPGGPMDESLDGMENVGIMTADQRPIYGKDDVVQATIRVRGLNSLPVGSRGWGFWKSERVAKVNQAVWFMEQTADPDSSWKEEETWARARTTNGLAANNQISTEIDEAPFSNNTQDWHTYTVIRNGRNYYRHYLDGVLVQEVVPGDFASGKILNQDYSFNCWNDNVVYHQVVGQDTVKEYTNGWIGTSEFVVDFIEIRSENYDPGYSVSPSGIIALREVPNEIDDGISDGLWKGPLTFNVSSGPCVILATAKAETYDGYGNDDNLKMVFDGIDFGYNTARSWNGDVDDGAPKTIIIDTTLSAGQHSLELHSQTTPILYDATVLSAPNGELVLDVTENETAPPGSDNLEWKTYNFNCDAGQVAVYISGLADEEPGWNHQGASISGDDDDELRVVLDGTDYGWGSDSSFTGNEMFGDSKTILITESVSAGPHVLKLYANETPTIHRVAVFVENKEDPSAVSEEIVPGEFKLQQNYPNPFNPGTKISFSLAKAGHARIDVFDVRGRWIKTLVDNNYASGSRSVEWNGKDSRNSECPSGIYYYRLTADNRQIIKKMTLLK